MFLSGSYEVPSELQNLGCVGLGTSLLPVHSPGFRVSSVNTLIHYTWKTTRLATHLAAKVWKTHRKEVIKSDQLSSRNIVSLWWWRKRLCALMLNHGEPETFKKDLLPITGNMALKCDVTKVFLKMILIFCSFSSIVSFLLLRSRC